MLKQFQFFWCVCWTKQNTQLFDKNYWKSYHLFLVALRTGFTRIWKLLVLVNVVDVNLKSAVPLTSQAEIPTILQFNLCMEACCGIIMIDVYVFHSRSQNAFASGAIL